MSKLATRYFIDLTQPEIAAQFKKNPLVILPAGSVEQHGPHLPPAPTFTPPTSSAMPWLNAWTVWYCRADRWA